ncbi:MAG: RDD family protein [Deltaproteobacteria bacterium]|nr:RDD family protein [Deltaproteobacteria bacterium]
MAWRPITGAFRRAIWDFSFASYSLRGSRWSGYFVILHGMEGCTVGKWCLGLRVVGARDPPVGYGRALVRWVGTLISGVSLLGFLWILWQRERRGWHDLLAGTRVIRE